MSNATPAWQPESSHLHRKTQTDQSETTNSFDSKTNEGFLVPQQASAMLGQNGITTNQKRAVLENAGGSLSNRQLQRLATQHSVHRQPAAKAGVVHRFDSFEHQSLGNGATNFGTVNMGGEKGDTRFELRHGDAVALNGDYFSLDDLTRLAAIPGNAGQKAGSRDEIIYALYLMDKGRNQDNRFQPGGQWANLNFSEDVKKAVDERYTKLAAANTMHFAAPYGRDAAGQPLKGPHGEATASSTYRDTHEQAIMMAYQAGRNGNDFSRALAIEAAGQHFLTDSFSAGHARTPTGLIREYWANKYPLFWYNLLHKIALDTATAMNDQSAAVTYVASVQTIYEGIMEEVNKLAGTLPAITFGDLLAKVFHDYDNENGLALKGGQHLYGDDNLDKADPKNSTRLMAQTAIKAGNRDLTEAYNLGKGGGAPLEGPAVYQSVRTATGASGNQYIAESFVPTLDPSVPEQNWKAGSLEELWDKPIAPGLTDTVGSRIMVALAKGGETREKLEGLASSFPASKYGMKPQDAYRKGFLEPLVKDPKAGLLSIINWSPNYGLHSTDRDDVSLETGEELKKKGQLSGMTTPARVNYIKELIDGYVADDEEQLVVDIFESAPASERATIYQKVEGHPWKGDWIHGVFTSDDDIWDALNKDRLKKVRDLINSH